LVTVKIKVLSVLASLTFLVTGIRAQTLDASQVDSTYFLGDWNTTSYSIESSGDSTFFHYTSARSGCSRKENCFSNVDPVYIVLD
jgi:hypothetical protein